MKENSINTNFRSRKSGGSLAPYYLFKTTFNFVWGKLILFETNNTIHTPLYSGQHMHYTKNEFLR